MAARDGDAANRDAECAIHKVIFMGTPEFAVPSLNALIDAGYEVAAVVTRPDKPKGRGRESGATPLKLAAAKHGLTILEPVDIREPGFIERIQALSPELVVVVAYGKILPRRFLEIPSRGCVNLHASLLPAYRGASPINYAVMNGERETGVTTMLMDTGMDTGPMLLREKIAIADDETAEELGVRLSKTGAALLVETIRLMLDNKITPQAQDDALATYAPSLKKGDGRIDWTRSAREVVNHVRGVYPWPGAYTTLGARTIKVFGGTAREDEGDRNEPGTIVEVLKEAIRVQCGSGVFEFTELQPENKRRMRVAEFMAGHKLTSGESFDG